MSAVLLGAAPSSAEERTELRTRLVYSVPSTCPDETRFRTLLAKHSEVVIDGAAPIVLRVEVTTDHKRHRGRVALFTTEEEGLREVVAERCEDVVRGLALFSAIALDAYFERPRKEQPEPPPPVPSEPSRAEPARPRTKPARPARPPPPAAPSPPIWLGVAVGQQNASGTRLLQHLGLSGELEMPWPWRTSVRLTASAGAVVPKSYRGGTLSFAMGWARIDACPAWGRIGRMLLASICPAGEIGLQRAALEGAAVGRTDTRLWTAIGALGRLRTPLGHRVELGASAGAVVPLLPFDFRTRAGLAYSTPSIVPVVELGLLIPLF